MAQGRTGTHLDGDIIVCLIFSPLLNVAPSFLPVIDCGVEVENDRTLKQGHPLSSPDNVTPLLFASGHAMPCHVHVSGSVHHRRGQEPLSRMPSVLFVVRMPAWCEHNHVSQKNSTHSSAKVGISGTCPGGKSNSRGTSRAACLACARRWW